MANFRYKSAMEYAHKRVEHVRSKASGFLPPLLLQVFRDYEYLRVAGDIDKVVFRPKPRNIILSFIRLLRPVSRHEVIICCETNMLNFSSIQRMKMADGGTGIVEFAVVNRFLALKSLAFLFATFAFIFKGRWRHAADLARVGIPRFIYFVYLQQVYHFLLCQTGSIVVYFSRGAPSYGRYLSDKFFEIQHGVLHDEHILVHPVMKPKGKYIIVNDFGADVSGLPSISDVEFISQFTRASTIHDNAGLASKKARPTGNMVVAFVPLTREDIFCSAIMKIEPGAELFYHPRSPKNKKADTPLRRIEAVMQAKCIFCGVGTSLFDVAQINPVALKVLLSSEDFEEQKISVGDFDQMAEYLNDHYSVNLSEAQLVLI